MKKQILMTLIFLILVNFSFTYNPEHLKVIQVREPFDYWYHWRKKNPNVKPDLSHAIIEKYSFANDFTNVNFRYAKIKNSSIGDTNFTGSDFSYSTITSSKQILYRDLKSVYKSVIFYKAKIIDSALFSVFTNTNFSESEIRNTNLAGSNFKNVSFKKAKILKSNIDGYFFNTDFSYAQIVKSKITSGFPPGIKMINIRFNNAKIIDSTIYALSSNNIDFSNSDLINTEFGPSRFTNVNFISANLIGSLFGNKYGDQAILTNVNFTNANLTNVNFQKATFQNVIFKNADMTGAKIERKWYDYIKKQGVRNFDKIKWE